MDEHPLISKSARDAAMTDSTGFDLRKTLTPINILVSSPNCNRFRAGVLRPSWRMTSCSPA